MSDIDSNFPQLRAVIVNYILPGKEDFLVVEYQQRGEEDLEFTGLADELTRAAKRPESAQALFAETLNFTGDVQEIRTACIELYNRLKGVGQFDKAKQEKVEGEELFQRTAGAPIVINGTVVKVRGRVVPMWAAWGGFLLIGLLGWALDTYVPWPSWLTWFPSLFRVSAFVGIAVTSAALVLMRSETRDPARAARRRKALEQAQARREAKRGSREGWFRRNMTF